MERPRRILVAGVSGSGKTTFARRVADITGSPHTEIDALFHGPGWVPRPEFSDDVQALVLRDVWTTEWQYNSVRPLLAEYADLLVWLDLPFWRVTFPRLVRRTLHRRRHRTELWSGNVEPPLWTIATDSEHIIWWGVRTRGKYTRLVPALEAGTRHLTVVRITSSTEAERWLAGPLQQRCGT